MKKTGFSLIEMLVSSALILFLLCGAIQLIILSLEAKRKADFLLAAASLAAAKFEYFKSIPFEDPALMEGEYFEAARFSFSKEVLCSTWSVGDIDEGMKKVVIEISRQNAPQKRIIAALLFCRELEF